MERKVGEFVRDLIESLIAATLFTMFPMAALRSRLAEMCDGQRHRRQCPHAGRFDPGHVRRGPKPLHRICLPITEREEWASFQEECSERLESAQTGSALLAGTVSTWKDDEDAIAFDIPVEELTQSQ